MGVAVGLCVLVRSLNAALDVVARPLYTSSVSLELELVLASFAALEPENTAVLSDKHHAGTGFDFFTRKVANSSFWHCSHRAFSLRASRPVSLSIKISPTRMGPTTFRLMIRPTSRGFGASLTRTLTCVASPVIPVRPTISTTSAGHPPSSSLIVINSQEVQLFLRALISSTTSWNFSWAPLVISITATEAAVVSFGMPMPLARNSWLGT